MASTYSTNLRLELIGTGDQSGTWGNTTNTNLGTLLEQAIAGYVTQLVTDGAATVLTIPNGSSSNGRNYVIELTGALTAARTVEVPAVDKPYIFFNNTTGGYAVTVKVSGQTGVTIANGKKAVVYTNSTDVIEVVNAPVSEAGTQTLTNKTFVAPALGTPASGTLTNCTGLPASTGITGTLAVANGGTGVTTSTGSGNNVLSNSPTLVTPALGTPASGVMTNVTGLPLTTGVTGTLPIANGGTNATTAGGALSSLGAAASATTITAGTGLSGGGDLSTNRTISLANTAVSAGSYTSANLTIDAQGRITSASNGGSGVGVGQTWQDLTSSRTLGTTYTNSTGKPIFISVDCFWNIQNGVGALLFVDSVRVGHIQGGGGAGGTTPCYGTLTAIVPDGSSYYVTSAFGTTNIQYWAELR